MELQKSVSFPNTKKTLCLFGTVEEPLFMLLDVQTILEATNLRPVVNDYPDTQRRTILKQTSTGPKPTIYLTEAGLYRVLFASRKPLARSFQDWVFSLLKGIRLDAFAKARSLTDTVDYKECRYQKLLELALQASHVRNRFGITDISTASSHVEVKVWKLYKHALGQLLFYDAGTEKSNRFVCFYGEPPLAVDLKAIVSVFAKYHIGVVSFLPDREDVVVRHSEEGEDEVVYINELSDVMK